MVSCCDDVCGAPLWRLDGRYHFAQKPALGGAEGAGGGRGARAHVVDADAQVLHRLHLVIGVTYVAWVGGGEIT